MFIRVDQELPEFLALCRAHSKKAVWIAGDLPSRPRDVLGRMGIRGGYVITEHGFVGKGRRHLFWALTRKLRVSPVGVVYVGEGEDVERTREAACLGVSFDKSLSAKRELLGSEQENSLAAGNYCSLKKNSYH
ncbi:hypothetical protein CC78DRAFT_565074 [Lojkania enalia]|uniref:Uncharacterized protein n=1 Tax=Lojkania enalia TaxID=147567 RepID=A0A9P4N9A1_9PLEO|nr:hypothetical protein CC78DRAFT_565074 [Didymosphaeria enalia]